jgi:mono/diheme cytochrome c family protein
VQQLRLAAGNRKAGRFPFLFAAMLLALPAQATHEKASEQEAAWNVVKERCYVCHYLDRAEVKFAPSLKDLFKRRTLSNGKPVNGQTVSEWIAEGSANMPAFKHTLTSQQVQLILKFLKEGRASNIPMLRNSR